MTKEQSNKVERILHTDDGFVYLYESDFAEGGTRDEALLNMVHKVAVAKRALREAQKKEFPEYLNFEFPIGLN